MATLAELRTAIEQMTGDSRLRNLLNQLAIWADVPQPPPKPAFIDLECSVCNGNGLINCCLNDDGIDAWQAPCPVCYAESDRRIAALIAKIKPMVVSRRTRSFRSFH
jgi:hypothetical protein